MGPNIKALAVQHIDGIKKAAEELSRLKGWTLGTAKGALKCIPVVIKEVERIGASSKMTGPEKQSLAVELLLKLIPLPWWLPVSFVRPLLDGIVDAVVDALKDKFA